LITMSDGMLNVHTCQITERDIFQY
jgi:hypothetical protein